jgi:putative transcriptional regulator
MANHHPDSDLLLAFSAGTLPLSHALCVSAHIERCDECTTNLQRLNNLGALMLEELSPAASPDQLKTSVMAQLDRQTINPQPAVAPPAPNQSSRVPRCLLQFIPAGYNSLSWHRVSPSIKAAKLCFDSTGAKVEMLRIKPGGKSATHTHTGDEYTVILEGSYSDESGMYCEGDFILRNSRHKHKPIASRDKECICLTVTDAPIKFTGWLTRWLNPLVNKSYLPV